MGLTGAPAPAPAERREARLRKRRTDLDRRSEQPEDPPQPEGGRPLLRLLQPQGRREDPGRALPAAQLAEGAAGEPADRQSVGEGKWVSVQVNRGGDRTNKKK